MFLKKLFCQHRNVEPYCVQTIKSKAEPSDDKIINITIETASKIKWRCKYCGKILDYDFPYRNR